MNLAPAFAPPGWAPRAAAPLPACIAAGSLLALALAAMLATPAAALDLPSTPALEASAAADAAPARGRAECTQCGVVESMRRVESAGGGAASYEFTVRLRDGSRQESSDASPGRWQVGDRILLIGEAAGAPG